MSAFGWELKQSSGSTTGDIGCAIQTHAEKNGLSVVRDFTGHGLGKVFHAPPTILHYGQPNTGDVLEEGVIFTVEPMIQSEDMMSKFYRWLDSCNKR